MSESEKERELAGKEGEDEMEAKHLHHRLKRIESHVGLEEYDPERHGPKDGPEESREEAYERSMSELSHVRKRHP